MLLLYISCASDVSIMKVPEADTSEQTILDSPQEDSSGEDPSSEIEPSGISGYFNYKLQQIACPACFGVGKELTVSAYGEFHEPISDSHISWKLSPGECSSSVNITSVSANYVTYGQSVQVMGPINEFYMPIQNNNSYFTDSLFENNYERDSSHTVSLNNNYFYFTSIHGFDYIEPYNMLYVDPSYAFDAPIYKTGAHFSWGPHGSESFFEITIDVYTPDGSQYIGGVTCASHDVGSMVIPSEYLMQYQQGSLVAIYLNRSKVENSEFVHMNSFIETHMEWEVIGTGHIE